MAILRDGSKIVEVSDELESFFYVILQTAIRYLPSNIECVGEYLENFFDAFTIEDGRYAVGDLKDKVMERNGKLTSTGKAKADLLTFKSPMDDVLKTLLLSFQAYYAVKEYDSRPAMLPLPQPTKPMEPRTPQPEDYIEMPAFHDDGVETDKEASSDEDDENDEDDEEWVPTKKDRKYAKNARSHKHFGRILADAVDKTWPDEKPKDRFEDDYKSTRGFGPTVTPSNVPVRVRRKLAHWNQTRALSGSSGSKKRKLSLEGDAPKEAPPASPKATPEPSQTRPKTKVKAQQEPRQPTRRSARLLKKSSH